MLRYSLAALFFVASAVITKGETRESAENRLTVSICPNKKKVSIGEYFDVVLRVVNSSNRTQSFGVMSGSWPQQWKTNNSCIAQKPWICFSNYPYTEILRPGETYERKLTVFVVKCDASVVSFKLGFTPLDETSTYWSNKVTVGIRLAKAP
jgi:hypothetical protein